MIPHVSRLLELWRIAAHYRLDTLFPAEELPEKARHALGVIRMHPAAWSSRERKNPLKLKQALEEMGPLAIKMGQLLSTRRDLIPPEVLQQLVLLQDRVKPFGSDVAKMRIQESLKADVNTLFARFDEQPLAAASIAQVHTAALHDGREVVVKVTRPAIRSQILQDFEILEWLGDFLEKRLEAARALHLSEIIQDYRQVILNELDLTLEADNTRRMRHYFTGSSMMYVPEVYMDSKDVMVAERITGVPISDIETFEKLGMDRKDLAEKGLTIFFTQVFRDNFFHADMHPGNIQVSTDPATFGRIILLDFGIVGTLTDFDKEYLVQNFMAFFQRDYRRIAELHIESGWVPAKTRVDELESAVRAVCEPCFDRPLREISLGLVLMRLFQTSRRFQVEIQPQLVLLQKTLLNVEGLGRELDPDMDVWGTARPFIEKWMKEQVGPRHLITQWRKQLPRMSRLLPQLPLLLHDYLERGARTQPHNRELQQLMQEQRQTNLLLRRLLYVAIGFVAGMMAIVLLPRLLHGFLFF